MNFNFNEMYRQIQDKLFLSDFDKQMLHWSNKVKNKNLKS
jgi:hypothetical protein